MRLGIYLGYASPGTNPTELVDRAVEAEALGYDSAWAAEAWGPPLPRTREYVELVRTMLRRDVVDFHGEVYDVPLRGERTTGLGIPLKMMMRPLRADIPIYLAAIGPKNVALATEIADGWLPIFVSPERLCDVFGDVLASAPDDFDIAAGVNVVLTKDREGGRQFVKHHLALYVGGMGARGKNFYNDLVCRYGYEAEAGVIQDLYLGGKKLEAAEAVPDALVDEVALVGSREEIADRLQAWQESGVTTLIVQSHDPETLRLMAELCL